MAILNLAWLVRVYRDGCRLDRDLETQIPPIQIDFHEIFRFSFASSKSFVDLSFLFLFMRFSRLKIGFRIIYQKLQLTSNLFLKIDEVKMKA